MNRAARLLATACAASAARRAGRLTYRDKFDRDPFVFDRDGRLLQLEYADAAAGRGGLCVGVARGAVAVLCGAVDARGDEKVADVDDRRARGRNRAARLQDAVSLCAAWSGRVPEHLSEILATFESGPRVPRRPRRRVRGPPRGRRGVGGGRAAPRRARAPRAA